MFSGTLSAMFADMLDEYSEESTGFQFVYFGNALRTG